MTHSYLLPVLLLATLLVACGDDATTPTPTPTDDNQVTDNNQTTDNNAADGTCVPSRDIWDFAGQELTERYCGNCHGETPDFGAPNSLINYDTLLKGEPGARLVDRMAVRMSEKTMPPAGTLVPHDNLDTLVLWASCGELHPDHSIGLTSTAPVFEAPEEAPDDMEHFNLLAPDFEVGEQTLNLYQCFTFDVPVDESLFIRRMEPVIDDSRVLHHIVVLRDPDKEFEAGSAPCRGMPGNADYLYAWAPGAGAIEFPDGGLRVSPGDRYIVQIHYNNGAGVKDVKDNSGMRFFTTPPEGTEYGMIAPGPLNFNIPANSSEVIEGTCKLPDDLTVLAGMPHMHEVGTDFEQFIRRADGTEESVIDLSGWSFELQYFYRFPITLKAGDELITRCHFDNKTGRSVSSGARTEDEMCFNFMYVTPPPSFSYCDSLSAAEPDEFEYTPGACAPEDAFEELATVEGRAFEEAVRPLSGGVVPDGHFKLSGFNLYFPDGVPIGEVDLEASYVLAAAQLKKSGDAISLDVNLLIHAVLGGLEFDQDVAISSSGVATFDAESGTSSIEATCPEEGSRPFAFEVDGDTLTLVIEGSQGGISSISEMIFDLSE